jgi:hypothetical protein
VSDFLTVDLPSTYSTRRRISFDAALGQVRGPVPVAQVQQWLMDLMQGLPQPTEYRFAADYASAVADYSLESWLVMRAAEPPSVEAAATEFRQTMAAAGDLSEQQIDQLCQRTFSMQRELPGWLSDTTERFLAIIKPWLPVWFNFTKWALHWCRQNSINTLAFLARDALPFFIVANALEPAPRLCLTHVSRTNRPDSTALDSVLRQPAVALIDSGCYGSCINDLRQQRDALIEPSSQRLATLLYYSRNPQLFGYMNYVMCKEMLTNPKTMSDAAEFVIYAGDLLEALPKPYQYLEREPAMVEPTDILSFTISLVALGEISSMAKAHTLLDAEEMDDIHEHVWPLYRSYQLSRHRSELRSDFPFSEPTPKSLPAPDALAGLEFLEIAPQSHIFGTVHG